MRDREERRSRFSSSFFPRTISISSCRSRGHSSSPKRIDRRFRFVCCLPSNLIRIHAPTGADKSIASRFGTYARPARVAGRNSSVFSPGEENSSAGMNPEKDNSLFDRQARARHNRPATNACEVFIYTR